jgi:hypothetical protein
MRLWAQFAFTASHSSNVARGELTNGIGSPIQRWVGIKTEPLQCPGA